MGILVLGAESSGNRLMTRLLVEMGCDGIYTPPYNDVHPSHAKPFVWLRSIPYAQDIPDLPALVRSAPTDDINAVVMIRDWLPMISSQIASGHAPNEQAATHRSRHALAYIFGFLLDADIPYTLVTYEGLISRPIQICRYLADRLGLSMPETLSIYDADAKWWTS